jgi:hypothetical protein
MPSEQHRLNRNCKTLLCGTGVGWGGPKGPGRAQRARGGWGRGGPKGPGEGGWGRSVSERASPNLSTRSHNSQSKQN